MFTCIVDTNSRACLHQDFANASLLYESAWKHDGDRVAVYTGLGRIALAQGHIRLASKCAKPVSFRLLVLAQRFERHCLLLRFHSSVWFRRFAQAADASESSEEPQVLLNTALLSLARGTFYALPWLRCVMPCHTLSSLVVPCHCHCYRAP